MTSPLEPFRVQLEGAREALGVAHGQGGVGASTEGSPRLGPVGVSHGPQGVKRHRGLRYHGSLWGVYSETMALGGGLGARHWEGLLLSQKEQTQD